MCSEYVLTKSVKGERKCVYLVLKFLGVCAPVQHGAMHSEDHLHMFLSKRLKQLQVKPCCVWLTSPHKKQQLVSGQQRDVHKTRISTTESPSHMRPALVAPIGASAAVEKRFQHRSRALSTQNIACDAIAVASHPRSMDRCFNRGSIACAGLSNPISPQPISGGPAGSARHLSPVVLLGVGAGEKTTQAAPSPVSWGCEASVVRGLRSHRTGSTSSSTRSHRTGPTSSSTKPRGLTEMGLPAVL